MKLFGFGRSNAKKAAEPSSTRRGLVLLDDTDLTRYNNNYQLYDTGHSTGQRLVLLDGVATAVATAAAIPPSAADRAAWYSSKSKSSDSFTNTGPVLGGGRFHDTPIICEEGSTLSTSPVGRGGMGDSKVSVSSVDALPATHGAIRAGGPADLFSSQYVGLLLNWIVIGFLNGGTQALVRPLFKQYLHMKNFQASAILGLLDFAWYFKFVFAFISDSCPVNRERRKPYMYIGWAVYAVFMVAMIGVPSVDPYYGSDGEVLNADAPSQGPRYVIPLMVASFAHLLVSVACEGMMVELAQREGEFARGRTQCIIVMFRFFGEFLGTIAIALSANSVEYGGKFSVSLPLQAIFGVFGFVALLGIVFTSQFLVEDRVSARSQPLQAQLRRVWSIVQRQRTWTLIVFGFVCKCATNYDILEASEVYTVWLNADSLDLNLATAVSRTGAVFASFLVYKLWINANWRVLLLGSLALGVVLALPVELMTYYDVVRDLAFYLTKDQFVGVCDAVVWLIRQLVIIEIAEPGYEATTYGFITTVYNLATPFVCFVTNVSASMLGSHEQDLTADTSSVRMHLTVEQIVKICIRVGLIVAVTPLLPRQKFALREPKASDKASAAVPVVLSLLFTLILVASIASNMLALFESTACLPFAGGGGCE